MPSIALTKNDLLFKLPLLKLRAKLPLTLIEERSVVNLKDAILTSQAMTIQFGSRLPQFRVLSATQRAKKNESLRQTSLIIDEEEQVATLPLLFIEPILSPSHNCL